MEYTGPVSESDRANSLTLYDTAIGKKAVMGVTGFVLFGFVIVHMLGNLQLYLGPQALNAYAHKLKHTPLLLWSVRTALTVSVVAHIVASTSLYLERARARPKGYRTWRSINSSYAGRTMIWSGPILLCFIVFHLANFTFPGVGFGGHAFSPSNVYANVVTSFSVPWVAAVYIVGQLALGFHLYHGSWSFMQSLGLNHPRYNRPKRFIAQTIAMLVVVANISFPVSVLTGVVHL
jgi:succinate dehydrogenase cytochrome b subunit